MDLVLAISEHPGLLHKLAHLKQNPLPKTPIIFAKIKLLWQCNLRCTFCELPAPTKPMPLLLVQSILNDLQRHGVQKIHFSGGEVFLHPQIKEILEDTCDRGLQVNLTTNGTLLDQEMVSFLIGCGVHSLSVSLDSAKAQNHDRLRGQKGALKATLKGIRYLMKKRLKKRLKYPKLRINTVVSRENIDDLPDLYALLTEIGENLIWNIIPVDATRKHLLLDKHQVQLFVEQAKKWDLVQNLYIGTSNHECTLISKGKYAVEFYHHHPCFMPWLHVFIDPRGFVYPCCMTRGRIPAFGNCRSQSLAQILASDSCREIKMNLAAGIPLDICHSCDDFIEENTLLLEKMKEKQ
ncbi:radical SAM/SPASM domain-containing protein [candidate division CSSED10-310 bacterium]|uniref:Radical SAM/SPASM domain-containing protein n=1 Tax=candidate division CSSED10-310 bacterium TaxID=2855610 RepID=A0ABV6YUF4_UNCC1